MDNRLTRYFSGITNLTMFEKECLNESMVIKEFKKDSYLLKQGQLNNETYFILEGFVRQFSMVDGEEITTDFFSEDQWIISLNNFAGKTASAHYLQCIEDTTVVTGTEEKARELFKKFPRFETISRQVMETVLADKQERMSSYITNTAEQRYINLLNTRPDIFQRAPQYHIASYIGVKPESLSRIRKRISNKL